MASMKTQHSSADKAAFSLLAELKTHRSFSMASTMPPLSEVETGAGAEGWGVGVGWEGVRGWDTVTSPLPPLCKDDPKRLLFPLVS